MADQVKVTSNDTTADYLKLKLVEGTNISLTELNDTSNETLEASAHASQVFRCVDIPSANWKSGAYPSGVLAATVSPTESTNGEITLSYSAAATMLANYKKFEWTSVASGGNITAGAQVAVVVPFHRRGNTIRVRARIYFNLFARLYSVQLGLNDHDRDGAIQHSSSQLAAISSNDDGKWCIVAPDNDFDVTGWEDAMRVCVTAQGTSHADNVGATDFRIEYITVEQW